MHLVAQGLAHFSSADIGYCVQGQAVEQLIVVEEVLSYAVDDQVEELVLLVQEEGHGQVADLLFGVLVGGDEVDGFEVAKVDIPTENINVQEL